MALYEMNPPVNGGFQLQFMLVAYVNFYVILSWIFF